ncbi:MAG: GHKL domain-containing protein [bacterium]|nr:GHKL domain-containing protein [bacterium]
MNDKHPPPHILIIGEKTEALQQLVQSLLHEEISVIHAYTPDGIQKHLGGKNTLIVADLEFLEAHAIRLPHMRPQASDAPWILLLSPGRDEELATLLRQPSVFYVLKSPWSEDEVHTLILRALEHSDLLRRQQELLQETQQLKERLALKNVLPEETATLGQIVRSEKMVMLGQMVAGIAHEINTPFGAINAAAVNMSHHLKKLMQSFQEFERAGMEREDIGKILRVVGGMVDTLSAGQRKSSGEIRHEQKRLMEMLEQQAIQNSRKLAKDIARMGLSGHTDKLLDLAVKYGTDEIFSFFTHCSRIINSTKDIQLSIEMLTRIVQALKSYSYPKPETIELADIHESLEIAVILLRNKFKQHVRMEMHLGELPEIWCYPGELSHVWINIIDNAIQAIKGRGQIGIETFHTQDHVGVRISDTGTGIHTDIQEQIFDINFTTKNRDEGTGLGLYIVRQIVEKHNGNITVNSRPGQTSFEVQLPIKSAG